MRFNVELTFDGVALLLKKMDEFLIQADQRDVRSPIRIELTYTEPVDESAIEARCMRHTLFEIKKVYGTAFSKIGVTIDCMPETNTP